MPLARYTLRLAENEQRPRHDSIVAVIVLPANLLSEGDYFLYEGPGAATWRFDKDIFQEGPESVEGVSWESARLAAVVKLIAGKARMSAMGSQAEPSSRLKRARALRRRRSPA